MMIKIVLDKISLDRADYPDLAPADFAIVPCSPGTHSVPCHTESQSSDDMPSKVDTKPTFDDILANLDRVGKPDRGSPSSLSSSPPARGFVENSYDFSPLTQKTEEPEPEDDSEQEPEQSGKDAAWPKKKAKMVDWKEERAQTEDENKSKEEVVLETPVKDKDAARPKKKAKMVARKEERAETEDENKSKEEVDLETPVKDKDAAQPKKKANMVARKTEIAETGDENMRLETPVNDKISEDALLESAMKVPCIDATRKRRKKSKQENETEAISGEETVEEPKKKNT